MLLKSLKFYLFLLLILMFLKIIKDNHDATDLKTDLNNLHSWSKSNDTFLNIKKCKVMRFNLIKNPIIFLQ